MGSADGLRSDFHGYRNTRAVGYCTNGVRRADNPSDTRGENQAIHSAIAAGMLTAANPAHALDAAMSTSLHIERHWRGASDAHRSATRML